jgi:phosphoribosylaminoimidazole (AIR) synthetase
LRDARATVTKFTIDDDAVGTTAIIAKAAIVNKTVAVTPIAIAINFLLSNGFFPLFIFYLQVFYIRNFWNFWYIFTTIAFWGGLNSFTPTQK